MTLLEALTAGILLALAGMAHCAGMCGALSMTMGFSVAEHKRQGNALWLWHGLYSLGRISSYVLMGSLMGWSGERVLSQLPEGNPLPWLLAAALMLIIALYLFGKEFGVRALERMGMALWRRIQPLMKPLMPVHHPAQALAIGLLWGLMPCGLVYSALALAAVSGNGINGALVMLVFGLITVFPVLGAGILGGRFQASRQQMLRKIGALCTLGFALWLGSHALPIGGNGHDHHQHHQQNNAQPSQHSAEHSAEQGMERAMEDIEHHHHH